MEKSEELNQSDYCINCNFRFDALSEDKMSKVVREKADESVLLPQALSLIFKWKFTSTPSTWFACQQCGNLLEEIYNALEDFKELTVAGSLLSEYFGGVKSSIPIKKERRALMKKKARMNSEEDEELVEEQGSSSLIDDSHENPEVKVKVKADLKEEGGSPPKKCRICLKTFSSLSDLRKHRKVHVENVSEDLDIMKPEIKPDVSPTSTLPSQRSHGKRLRKRAISEEVKKVDGSLQERKSGYKCEVCGKEFSRPDHCQLHLRTHTREKPFCCRTCGKAFSDPRGLSFHEITHSKERPFCCTICGQTFKRRHHLNDHEKNHRDVPRPFECSLCGKAFKYKKHLNSHASMHRTTKEFSCPFCSKGFNRKDNLTQHIKLVHEKTPRKRAKSKQSQSIETDCDLKPSASSSIVRNPSEIIISREPQHHQNLQQGVITLPLVTSTTFPGNQGEILISTSAPGPAPQGNDDNQRPPDSFPVLQLSDRSGGVEQIVYMPL